MPRKHSDAIRSSPGPADIRVIDLSQPLDDAVPRSFNFRPEFGKSWPFRLEEISKYDNRGPAWYWNNFSCGEHTGTHFDAPIHWVTGKDFPQNATDTIPVESFFAPACVIDVSREVAANPDFLLTPQHVEGWEAKHGRIEAGSWVLMRTDWSKRIRPGCIPEHKGRRCPRAGSRIPIWFLSLPNSAMSLAGARKAWAPMPDRPFDSSRRFRATPSCTARTNLASPAWPISTSFRPKARS